MFLVVTDLSFFLPEATSGISDRALKYTRERYSVEEFDEIFDLPCDEDSFESFASESSSEEEEEEEENEEKLEEETVSDGTVALYYIIYT